MNLRIVLLSIILAFVSTVSLANNSESQPEAKKKIDVEEIIIGHITNAYNYHIFTLPNGKPVSIPLPVILYSKNSGFHVFMSSKFGDGNATYENFKIAHKGVKKGKIVEVDKDGKILNGSLYDFSLSKVVVGIFVVCIILLLIFLSAAKTAKRNPNKAPKGILSLVEPLILFVRDDIAIPIIGKKYKKFIPYLLTIFFFVFFCNLFGLIPIPPFGANLSGNISVTATIALITFIITTVHGNKHYWKDIVNTPGVPWWLKLPLPLMPFVEVVGVFTKPIILAIRLFANMTAGHIVMLAFITLIFIFGALSPIVGYAIAPVSIGFTVFIILLDVLVSFIQAFVFTLLSAIYFGMATEEHHS